MGWGAGKWEDKMMKRLFMAAVLIAGATMASAEERVTLGWGRMFSNDQIGDGSDRWQTGSYSVSRVRGVSWSGYEAAGFGDILELRGHAAIIAPESLTAPAPTDRRYAGILGFGMNTHFGWYGAEVALGAELMATGPSTGIGRFQKEFHELVGYVAPSPAVLGNQIGDKIHPGINGEIGKTFALGGLVQARPYVEARAGLESLVRVGGDITIGHLGRDGLMLRDVTTGQRYRGVEGSRSEGFSLTLGGDMARVFDSALLPSGGAATLEPERYRLRAGLHWQGKRASTFYGVSYLSPEFVQQREGQLVGALSLNLRF